MRRTVMAYYLAEAIASDEFLAVYDRYDTTLLAFRHAARRR